VNTTWEQKSITNSTVYCTILNVIVIEYYVLLQSIPNLVIFLEAWVSGIAGEIDVLSDVL